MAGINNRFTENKATPWQAHWPQRTRSEKWYPQAKARRFYRS